MAETAAISADRRNLARAIKLANSCVDARNTVPILGSLKATANGSLCFEGTDLDTFSRAAIPYTGEHGSFCLPDANRLLSALNVVAADDVSFHVDDDTHVNVSSGAFKSQITTQSTDDFPAIEMVGEELWGVDIGAAELAQIARLLPAICAEEIRYYLHGIAVWHLSDWTWRFASTDGHRLTYVDIPLPGAVGALPGTMIIPRRFIKLALAQFSRTKSPIRLSVGPRVNSNHAPAIAMDIAKSPSLARIQMRADLDGIDFTFASKMIDGPYPDVMRVVPTSASTSARIQRADLVTAIRALSPMAAEKTRAIKLVFTGERLDLFLASAGFASSHISIAAECSEQAEPFEIGANGRYLLDMLAALGGDEVVLEMNGNSAPITFINPSDTAFRGIMMPMRV